MGLEARVARIDSFRAEGQVEVFANFKATFFKYRFYYFFRRTRVSGRFKNDKHIFVYTFRYFFGGVYDVRKVWLLEFIERRGDADSDDVTLHKTVKVGCGGKVPVCGKVFEVLRNDVSDVVFTAVDHLDL